MPIAHACHTCGHLLTHVQARWDEGLGLPVVVCPECRAACVRRPHPLRRGWRGAVKCAKTGWGLAWRGAAIGVLGIMAAASSAAMQELSQSVPLAGVALHVVGVERDADVWDAFTDGRGEVMVVFAAASWGMAGVLAGAASGPTRRWWRGAGLFLLGVLAALLAAQLFNAVGAMMNGRTTAYTLRWERVQGAWLAALGSAVVMLAGVGLGLRVRRLLAWNDLQGFRRLRRRVVQRRAMA